MSELIVHFLWIMKNNELIKRIQQFLIIKFKGLDLYFQYFN